MTPRRSVAAAAIGAMLLVLPAVASAHTGLASSDPADGSRVTDPPAEVVLTFDTELAEDAAFTVTGPGGAEVGDGTLDLDVADRNVVRGEVTVELPGTYVVAYSLAGDDGHRITGEVSFTFAPDGPASPNTAAARTDAARFPPTGVAGMALVLLAAILLGRKAVRG